MLGADGFGYAFDGTGHRKIPQVGGLRIEDDVEIGANSTIDRATLGETLIRRGSKIDNLVQVGHNCDVGEDVILAAQAGVSGSCTIVGETRRIWAPETVLPDLLRGFRALEKRVRELEGGRHA